MLEGVGWREEPRCQEEDYHAKRYSTGKAHSGGEGMMMCWRGRDGGRSQETGLEMK